MTLQQSKEIVLRILRVGKSRRRYRPAGWAMLTEECRRAAADAQRRRDAEFILGYRGADFRDSDEGWRCMILNPDYVATGIIRP